MTVFRAAVIRAGLQISVVVFFDFFPDVFGLISITGAQPLLNILSVSQFFQFDMSHVVPQNSVQIQAMSAEIGKNAMT